MHKAGFWVGIIILLIGLVIIGVGIYYLNKESKETTYTKGYSNLGWGLTLGGVILFFSGLLVIVGSWRITDKTTLIKKSE